MSFNPDNGDTARYVRLTGVISAGEGLDLEVEELEVLIMAVQEVVNQLGFHTMLNWQIVTWTGVSSIAITGPKFLEQAD